VTAREIVDELLVVEHPVLQRRVLLVLPTIPENAPYKVREGIARRRIAATTGTCPCGAITDYGSGLPSEPGMAEVLHEYECPAVTDTLAKAIRRWER